MKTIKVVGAIIVGGDGKIFATQRGYGNLKGGWEFPGGKVEPFESDKEALIRELKEELDVVVEIERFFHMVDYQYEKFRLNMNCYICRITDGVPKLIEHSNAKWLGKGELKSVEWLPADIEVVDRIIDEL
ncbi:MAG TPA: (deoxy)nucleoside triphosphate pyrophosphohydrolase [Anaerovoracaceae bacterium]|nr:(deoxy)nucleoside triphosphate pyrophosphohydrolase [Anaerovoracaceae bacterium]